MDSPVIILHVVGRLDRGGAESRIMDLYRQMDRDKVQFYFAQHTADRCAFAEEIETLGGRIFTLPRFKVANIRSYKKAWKKLFKSHPEIKMVQGHMTSTASIYLPIAKRAGIEKTIAHARSAGVEPGLKGWLTRLMRKNLWKKCDYCFTCSHLAGEVVFGKQAMSEGKVYIIPNAIEVEKFAFDEKVRKELRYELGLEGCFVLGHVGRFCGVKNHFYLLDILEEGIALERKMELPRLVLLLLGEGELEEKVRQSAAEKGISSRVYFLGNQKDVYRYYQAMDYFLLPSFYEGLPGTAIEAQASGLPGILSDTVTREAVITDLLKRLSIRGAAAKWAEIIADYAAGKMDGDIEENLINERRIGTGYAEQVKAAGYEVKDQADRLQRFYLEGEEENVRNLRILR